ncbi:ABC transporter substrate-binding protein [Paenibacillus thiaminolyticus]|uniref:ABC transporter substrate-binding protein n=1 Tax=Paenibacillus thiaminolyticus TaxID=49283 RepID=A0A3A3GAI6_PANTH|nr:ABC transporter substrate-binding protein [Paenibacillus thiaminolyticus]RJG19142.1 ABC transporter substrate-binding protein [Paenibacillus thiaminolyticus]
MAATVLAAVMIMMLLGCANDNQNAGLAATGPDKAASADTANSNRTGGKEQGTEQASPRTYTDYKGHTIELPASMTNVIFAGETTGDLIELGIPMVGIFGDHLEGRRYEKEASQIENVGFPINLEKVTSLNPDIIIIGSVDEKEVRFGRDCLR